MKVGLFFGSFNPIHIGHLIIANYMVDNTEMDQVWFVVSPQNPLKNKSSLLADYHRLALVKEAIEGNNKLRASDIEFNLSQPSYTVNTLEYLKEKYPSYDFSLIMGEDNIRTIKKWRNWEQLLENYTIQVYPRVEGREIESLEWTKEFPTIRIKENVPLMNISASYIRKTIANGGDVRYLLSEATLKYLDEMNFYKN